MADTWTLNTPGGNLTLNPSFAAVAYQPGGVDGNAIRRRDDRVTPQRSGDGLRTPGALRLYGKVWSDAQTIPLLLDELDDIREAVAACTSVVRATTAGTFTYDDLAGGPPPEVTPDGLGGFDVRIELWPGRAAATFAPVGGSVSLLAAGVQFHTFDGGVRTLEVAVPGGAAPSGSLIVMGVYGSGSIDDAPGWTSLGSGYAPMESRSGQNLWAFRQVVGSPVSNVYIDLDNYYGLTHTAVLIGDNLVTADLVHASVSGLGSSTPLGITGTATRAGIQLLLGDVTSFGIG